MTNNEESMRKDGNGKSNGDAIQLLTEADVYRFAGMGLGIGIRNVGGVMPISTSGFESSHFPANSTHAKSALNPRSPSDNGEMDLEIRDDDFDWEAGAMVQPSPKVLSLLMRLFVRRQCRDCFSGMQQRNIFVFYGWAGGAFCCGEKDMTRCPGPGVREASTP
eukprot:CAMPEP_0175047688 /NCGR_PEP_ID=MMETSP0052_2-20121109/5746_1 /TAXON_ID=51329 ORGANISM="Polytomella parva, Strain SAG 63-3" /NCGR_SAMPLE_ID=MMETSP0052_2 /ASSEMBLY_ACC=CAM_ASM_000194 /LENGTH=162 /DNA_ID=CAMNT_0016311615 /DNA_START=348 /DNA_END=836 /DNA_ORIENTATION=+